MRSTLRLAIMALGLQLLLPLTGVAADPPTLTRDASDGIASGSVYVEGQRIEPPYTIETLQGRVLINTRLIHPDPRSERPSRSEAVRSAPGTKQAAIRNFYSSYRELLRGSTHDAALDEAAARALARGDCACIERRQEGVVMHFADGDSELLFISAEPRDATVPEDAAAIAEAESIAEALRAGYLVAVGSNYTVLLNPQDRREFEDIVAGLAAKSLDSAGAQARLLALAGSRSLVADFIR